MRSVTDIVMEVVSVNILFRPFVFSIIGTLVSITPLFSDVPNPVSSIHGAGIVVKDKNNIRVSRDDNGRYLDIVIPKEDAKIESVRSCEWSDGGIAIAVKCSAGDGKYYYFWITIWINKPKWINDKSSTDGVYLQAISNIIENDINNYDVDSIKNPEGDAICVVLTRLEKMSLSPSGYIYVHNCPMSENAIGHLYKIDAIRVPKDSGGK